MVSASCYKNTVLLESGAGFCQSCLLCTGSKTDWHVILLSGWIEGGKIGFGLRLPETMEINAREHKLLAGPSRLRLSWVTGGKCVCWDTGLCGILSWKLLAKNLPVPVAFYSFQQKQVLYTFFINAQDYTEEYTWFVIFSCPLSRNDPCISYILLVKRVLSARVIFHQS